MIISREVCFLILAVALGSISGFHCPTNCTCREETRPIEIKCPVKNDSSFTVEIDRSYGDITIKCINSPDWSDFPDLDVTDLNMSIQRLNFNECDLRSNNNLGEITRKLWVTDVKRSIQSTKNLNSVLDKHHSDDFENLKYPILSSNNVSYVDKDQLIDLTTLELIKTKLDLVGGFFNYAPGLKKLELIDNGLRSIELGTFDDLKNLTRLYLYKNHLTELQSGIFDELVAVMSLYFHKNDLVKLPEDIFAKLANLESIDISGNNFTDLPRNLLQNKAKLEIINLSDNKRNMTTLPNKFFVNLKKLGKLDLIANGFVTLPEDLFWGCTSLTFMNLKQNYLQSLPERIFRDLTKLKYLYLNSNNLKTLPDYIFSNTKQLINLDLSKNRITSISKYLFNGLYVLVELNMEENQLMTISKFSFSSLKNLKIAKLSKNYNTNISQLEISPTISSMTTLPNEFFANLTELKMLDLAAKGFVTLPQDLFWGCTSLTVINLEQNYLQSLPEHIFRDLTELKYLYLNSNNLETLPDYIFSNTNQLKNLDLSKNRITSISKYLFNGLYVLEELNMEENQLMTISKFSFSSLKNLKIAKLSKDYNTNISQLEISPTISSMTTLPNEFFANLTELKMLDLSAKGFVTLPENLFWECTSLTYMNLEQNHLQSLPEHIFRDLTELKYLYLNSNDLETLPDYIFSNTHQLINLDLSKNRITSFSEHLFNGLKSLKELSMEDNRLMFISFNSFRSLRNLKIAKFSKNNLTFEDSRSTYKYIFPYIIITTFNHCISLEELYLANNNISKIFIDWTHLSQLRELDLKYNNIPYITTEDVQFVSKNIKVDLTNNKIKHIFLPNIEKINYFNYTYKDMKILVDNNPLHCDCRLYNFLRYIEGRIQPRLQNYFHIIQENLTCQTPKELKNMHVTALRSKSLTCVSNYKACPEMCNCLERPEDNAFIFDCSHRNLTSVPNNIKIDDSFRFELNFSGNRLTRMPNLKVMKLESVKNLTLSHNSITEISLDGLSSTIEVLELHNNSVSRIQPKVLELLKHSMNLTRLTLHENPWECDCDAKEFQSFIRNPTKIAMIPDLINVKCVGSNISVSKTTDSCEVNTANNDQVNTAIIGVSITISLMCFFGLLYYKYQRQIKVWLFAHHWCLWFVTEEELDKEKLYDAFISYSHKDEDFVENELVSKLENGSTPFKLCLHYRDWLAGEWITANIARSVENSRRTIIVLSPNFLESGWGRMEFRAAHEQALSEGRARVILILYGDIGPIDNLDPELKAYINMNTYVEWGDPWFWDKLRYALPHQSNLARHSDTGNKIFENHQMCIQANGQKKELVYQFPLARYSESEI